MPDVTSPRLHDYPTSVLSTISLGGKDHHRVHKSRQGRSTIRFGTEMDNLDTRGQCTLNRWQNLTISQSSRCLHTSRDQDDLNNLRPCMGCKDPAYRAVCWVHNQFAKLGWNSISRYQSERTNRTNQRKRKREREQGRTWGVCIMSVLYAPWQTTVLCTTGLRTYIYRY